MSYNSEPIGINLVRLIYYELFGFNRLELFGPYYGFIFFANRFLLTLVK